jgi:NitT/TauT family transport system permease protein
VVAVAVLGAWAAASTRISPVLLPSPGDVAGAFAAHAGTLAEATLTTGGSALAGLALAAALGFVGALLFQRSALAERALYPYALFLQTLPVVAIAPLLVVWLGYGPPVAVGSAALVSFFPVLTSAHAGLAAADPDQVALLRLYKASWWQELRLLRIPGSLPYVFAGLRTAAGLSTIGAIVGEFVGSNGFPACLGYLVLKGMRAADTGLIFAAIACAALLATVFFGAVRLLGARLVGRWHPGGGA